MTRYPGPGLRRLRRVGELEALRPAPAGAQQGTGMGDDTILVEAGRVEPEPVVAFGPHPSKTGARVGVPEAGSVIETTGEAAAAIWRKSDAEDRVSVTLQGQQTGPRIGIPEAGGAVVAGGEELAAVGGKGAGRDPTAVARGAGVVLEELERFQSVLLESEDDVPSAT